MGIARLVSVNAGEPSKESTVAGEGRVRQDGRFWYPIITTWPATKAALVISTLDHEVPEEDLVRWRDDPQGLASADRVFSYKQAAKEPARRLARRQQMASLLQEMGHNQETIDLLNAQSREMTLSYETLRLEEQFLDLERDYETENSWG